MAAPTPQTPQRPMPGRFFNTPAQGQQSQSFSFQPAPSFRLVGHGQQQSSSTVAQPGAGVSSNVNYPALNQAAAPAAAPSLSLIERAAKTINDKLEEEGRYPPLDNYLIQGASADYDLPASQAWGPFQLMKQYNIPDEIFDQYNRAQISTAMGLFAEIHHAWVAIDNSLYLWDYTHPAPELLGYEDATNNITAVRLVIPRAGVFVGAIKYVLVVATSSDVHLIGIKEDRLAGDAPITVSLFRTKMHAPCKGLNVTQVAGSAASGRIFFAGTYDNDVYELQYQQEERWFHSNCGKINHTRKGLDSLVSLPSFTTRGPTEFTVQMELDDSRNTLYTLSNLSTIRAFHLRSGNDLNLSLTRTMPQILSDVQHKASAPDLFGPSCKIVSINPITSKEASRISLVAITDSGCRIYFSGLSGYYSTDTSGGLTSLQVHHVKFPPPDSSAAPLPPPTGGVFPGQTQVNASQALKGTRAAQRFAPGYFLAFIRRNAQGPNESIFMTAPDSGRIAHPQDASQANRFPEFGMWYELQGQMQAAGVMSPSFAASGGPLGFGNELAVQFDRPTSEIAILTNSGVYQFRRRRMVDIFAAAIRYGGGDDGLDGEIRNFAHLYGRGETIATALAVACGQASEVSVDSRVLRITDNDILEFARRTFIEHGGRPEPDQNIIPASDTPSIDQVRPSPRHEGLALYISRLLRSVWKAQIMLETRTPAGGLAVSSAVSLDKLQGIQRDLVRLQEFLNSNKTFIEGLAGPDALGRVSTKQDEVALQAEHRALSSIVRLISDVIEGISFVLVLFAPAERPDEIVTMLPDSSRESLRAITFERLFCTSNGKDLAKELVKAIVNRNIAAGSNVDTVTDALRRKCGSFCSADDSIIFKAQEQLKRASDTTASTEVSRGLLNEGLRLLQKVAGSLSLDQLRWAVEQFVAMEFFAGAVQLCLSVAQESDRGNRALSWFRDGMPGQDSRSAAFESRQRCYVIIHEIISALERSNAAPEMVDGQFSVLAKRKREAYDLINSCPDEMFQMDLYDWYLNQGRADRLLEVQSPFVVTYLERKSQDDLTSADLLWRYHAHYGSFIEAARVQLQLAKSTFPLSLEQRVQYLSFAKTNASTKSVAGLADIGRSRQSRQDLLREIGDLLDLANIQSDILHRIRNDERIIEERRVQVAGELDGQILDMTLLFNRYADGASYYDITLQIYRQASYSNPSDIKTAWSNLIAQTHDMAAAQQERGGPQPFEMVGEKVRSVGARLNLAEATFPVPLVTLMLERYVLEKQRKETPENWVPSLLLSLEVPFEGITSALEALWFMQEVPFQGRGRTMLASDLIFTLRRWCEATGRTGPQNLFGGEEYAAGVLELIEQVQAAHHEDQQVREMAQALATRVRMLTR